MRIQNRKLCADLRCFQINRLFIKSLIVDSYPRPKFEVNERGGVWVTKFKLVNKYLDIVKTLAKLNIFLLLRLHYTFLHILFYMQSLVIDY